MHGGGHALLLAADWPVAQPQPSPLQCPSPTRGPPARVQGCIICVRLTSDDCRTVRCDDFDAVRFPCEASEVEVHRQSNRVAGTMIMMGMGIDLQLRLSQYHLDMCVGQIAKISA